MISFLFLLSIWLSPEHRRAVSKVLRNENEIKDFIKSHKRVVIIHDDDSISEYAKFAVLKYNDTVSFGHALPSSHVSKYCLSMPCFSAYVNGIHVRSSATPVTAASFAFWVRYSIVNNTHHITKVQTLRDLLTIPGPSLFGVNVTTRPKYIPSVYQFYMVDNKTMWSIFGQNLKGIYLYKPAERNLVFVDDFVGNQGLLHSQLLDYGNDDLTKFSNLGFYFIDYDDDKTVSPYEKMKKLSSNKFKIAVVGSNDARGLRLAFHVTYIHSMTFIAVSHHDLSRDHEFHILTDHDIIRETMDLRKYISSFIRNESYQFYKKLDTFGRGKVRKLTYTNLFNWWKESCPYSVILINSTNEFEGPDIGSAFMIQTVADAFAQEDISFLYYDQGQNLLFPYITYKDKFPRIIFLLDKTKGIFVEYEGDLNVYSLVAEIENVILGRKTSDYQKADAYKRMNDRLLPH